VTSAQRPNPAAQSTYQVRFDWGLDGVARIAPGADVLVVIDVLGAAWRVAEHGPDAADRTAATNHSVAPPLAPPIAKLLAAVPAQTSVLSAGFTTAHAAARWIVERQHALGRRTMIALVAAGGVTGGADVGGTEPTNAETPGGIRFAVENQLAAGAVIDALATLGIDFCSPEAAASCAAFTGLRGAVAHLLTASASAQQLVAAGVAPATIRAAGALDTGDTVTVLRDA
jgi:2-phosphosulfolactate phosphatase